MIACFPVYRTYVAGRRHRGRATRDRQHIDCARSRDAKRRNPRDQRVDLRLHRATCCCCAIPTACREPSAPSGASFVLRFQQLTGPVMAKGLEDTAFYATTRSSSLNEVGGEPDRFGVHRRATSTPATPRAPAALAARAVRHRHPRHQARRGHARAPRRAVRDPARMAQAVSRWQRMNRRAKPLVDEARVPDRNEEYLLYQTLLGAWPLEALERSCPSRRRESLASASAPTCVKALREAKVHTSWINLNEPYERGVDQFLRRLLAPRDRRRRSSPTCDGPGGACLMPGHLQLAGAGRSQGDRAWRPRLLPGDRALGPRAGRSGQPPPGRLRARALLAELDALEARAAADPEAVPDFIAERSAAARPTARSRCSCSCAPSPSGATTGSSIERGDYVPLTAEGDARPPRRRLRTARGRRDGDRDRGTLPVSARSGDATTAGRRLGRRADPASGKPTRRALARRHRRGNAWRSQPRTAEHSNATRWIRLAAICLRASRLALLETHSLGSQPHSSEQQFARAV